jgi:hypothetical protein
MFERLRLWRLMYGLPRMILPCLFGDYDAWCGVMETLRCTSDRGDCVRRFWKLQSNNCSMEVLGVSYFSGKSVSEFSSLRPVLCIGYGRCTNSRHFSTIAIHQSSTLGNQCVVDRQHAFGILFGILRMQAAKIYCLNHVEAHSGPSRIVEDKGKQHGSSNTLPFCSPLAFHVQKLPSLCACDVCCRPWCISWLYMAQQPGCRRRTYW